MSDVKFHEILNRLNKLEKHVVNLETLIKNHLTQEKDLDNKDETYQMVLNLLALPKLYEFSQEEMNEESLSQQKKWLMDNET